MKSILIDCVLFLHGWRKCKLADGKIGWKKQVSPQVRRIGPTEYALAHLKK